MPGSKGEPGRMGPPGMGGLPGREGKNEFFGVFFRIDQSYWL